MEKPLLPIHEIPKTHNKIKKILLGCGILITSTLGFLFYPRPMHIDITKTLYYPMLGESYKTLEVYNPNLYNLKIQDLSLTQYYKDCNSEECLWVPSWSGFGLLDKKKIMPGETKYFDLLSNVSDIAQLTKLCLENNLFIYYKGEYVSPFGKTKMKSRPFLIECTY
jgi:hypothetical protein